MKRSTFIVDRLGFGAFAELRSACYIELRSACYIELRLRRVEDVSDDAQHEHPGFGVGADAARPWQVHARGGEISVEQPQFKPGGLGLFRR